MSTAPLENAPTTGGARFTKIYDIYGNHIITRDANTELEWLAGFVGIWANQGTQYGDAAIICRQLTACGYDDWRVPTLKEALSANGADAYWYWGESGPHIWTCTPEGDADLLGLAWVVKFGTDHAFRVYRTIPHHVRPVRGQMRTDATATPKAGES